jgi:AraC family transcriptional regulator
VTRSGVIVPSGSGYFLMVRRQEVTSLTLTEALYPHETIEPTHSHSHAYFEVILKGGYTENEQRRTLDYRALSVAYEPVKEPHSSRIHVDGLHNLRIEMDSEWLARIGNSLDRPYAHGLETAANFNNGPLAWMGVRLYDEWRKMDAVSSLIIEGCVLEMIAETIRCRTVALKRSPPLWLKEAVDLLHAGFTEPLTLESIAQAVGIHPIYLARAFRQQYQCSVGDYIRRLRIDYACKQIATTETPLAAIALAAGFADQSHFSRVFKQVAGLSPSAFRNRCSASSRIDKI